MTRYISLFSGIECASVAAKPLGWEPVCFSEVEPFPCAVLAHHYPHVPNVGDMTTHDWSRYRGMCDVVIGGSPCQAFSVAGRRESLADERGNLTLSFVEAVNAIDPAFVVWENVPGVLNTRDNAFGCFLAALAGHDRPLPAPGGEKWGDAGVVIGPRRALAWRLLDAQHFGVPQRRRRIYLVGCSRAAGVDPAEILFEPRGMPGHPAPGGKAGKETADDFGGCIAGGCGDVAGAVTSKWAKGTGGPAGDECYNLVAHTLRGEGFDASEDGTGRGTPLVMAFHGAQDPDVSGDVTHPVGRNQGQETCVAFTQNQEGDVLTGDVAPALGTNANATGRNTAKVMRSGVRRLTPRECERLQGLPDDYTRIPWRGKPAEDCPDGPRYRAIGNGMAVVCVGWIFGRIEKKGLR